MTSLPEELQNDEDFRFVRADYNLSFLIRIVLLVGAGGAAWAQEYPIAFVLGLAVIERAVTDAHAATRGGLWLNQRDLVRNQIRPGNETLTELAQEVAAIREHLEGHRRE